MTVNAGKFQAMVLSGHKKENTFLKINDSDNFE